MSLNSPSNLNGIRLLRSLPGLITYPILFQKARQLGFFIPTEILSNVNIDSIMSTIENSSQQDNDILIAIQNWLAQYNLATFENATSSKINKRFWLIEIPSDEDLKIRQRNQEEAMKNREFRECVETWTSLSQKDKEELGRRVPMSPFEK